MVHLLLPLIFAFASGAVVDIEPATFEREGPVRKASDSVVRVRLNSLRDVRTMESLSGDMWSHGIYGGEADYQVSPEQLAALNRTKLEYCVMNDPSVQRNTLARGRYHAQWTSCGWFCNSCSIHCAGSWRRIACRGSD